MTVSERLEDISQRSGLSKDIVRRVLNSSRESLIHTLQDGEPAVLPGIGTLRVTKSRSKLAVHCKVSDTIAHNVNKVSRESSFDTDESVDILQIPGLA